VFPAQALGARRRSIAPLGFDAADAAALGGGDDGAPGVASSPFFKGASLHARAAARTRAHTHTPRRLSCCRLLALVCSLAHR
jgi:hypothetical protein